MKSYSYAYLYYKCGIWDTATKSVAEVFLQNEAFLLENCKYDK